MKLTSKQREYLRGLRDNPERYEVRGVTNATMSALEKRGFTKIKVELNPGGWNDFLWYLTDAGRAELR
jgi:hypothetical protein